MFEATSEAANRARRGEGPTLIESTVERLLPHTTDDDHSKYRRKDDIEGLSRMDPLPITSEKLISINVLSKSDIQMMEKEAKEAKIPLKQFKEIVNPETVRINAIHDKVLDYLANIK